MAKIVRKTAKIFGSSAGTNQIAEFGSLFAGTPVFSTDPAVIQSLTNWLQGWFAAVEDINSPAIEDMNAFCYVMAYQIAYILQQGIGEWDSGTTYYTNSYVSSGNTIYVSLQDNNLNHAVSDGAWWAPYLNVSVNGSGDDVCSVKFYAPNFITTTTNPASAGFIRMAKTEGIYWRNNANSADLSVTIDSSDNVVISTSVKSPAFISSTANPASAGQVRLAKTDSIKFRNNANSADITTSLDTDDSFLVSSAVKTPYFTTNASNVASTGQVRLAKTELVNWRNNANSGDVNLGLDTSDNVNSSTGYRAPLFSTATANVATSGQYRLARADTIAVRNNANSANNTITFSTNDSMVLGLGLDLTSATLSTTGSQNNISTLGTSEIRYTGAGTATITGFANGEDGKILVFINTTSNAVTFKDNSGSSSAGNKITMPVSGADLVLPGSTDTATFGYDSSNSRWELLSTTGKLSGSFSANFNQGAGASGSNTTYTINWAMSGRQVTLVIPDQTMTAGATAAAFGTTSGVVPSTIMPATDHIFVCRVRANNAAQSSPGYFVVTSGGTLQVTRSLDNATNWTATQANNGITSSLAVTYIVGV